MKNLDKNVKIAMLSAICAMIISSVYIFIVVKEEIKKNKVETMSILENQSIAIKNEFDLAVNQVYELRALIYGNNGKLDYPNYIIDRIIDSRMIRNVVYAPNSVVKQVYPLKGNEGVIGLDLLGKENESNVDAKLAVDTDDVILTGPYNLKQGGEAFSARVSVRIPDKNAKLKYVGLVSVTVNSSDVISRNSMALLDRLGYDFVLCKKDKNTNNNIKIISNISRSEKDMISTEFSVKNIKFVLRAIPRKGWYDKGVTGIKIFTFFAFSLAVGIFAGFIFSTRQNLIERANTDALTNIYNRDGGVKQIMRRVNDNTYEDGGLLLMDIDFFKGVNDTFGHQKGDEILIETADMLKRTIRNTDVVCRLGGDEFMVYFPFNGSRDFVYSKAEDIRRKMEREVVHGDNRVKISASIGVTFLKESGNDFGVLYKAADSALYKSKKGGKNKISIA